jgi:hypothetical protein
MTLRRWKYGRTAEPASAPAQREALLFCKKEARNFCLFSGVDCKLADVTALLQIAGAETYLEIQLEVARDPATLACAAIEFGATPQ